MPGIFKNFKPVLPAKSSITAFMLIVIIGVAADLYSKSAIFTYLENNYAFHKSVVDGFFNIVKAENTGAAWSSFQGQKFFLIGVSVIALAAILFIFFTGQLKGKTVFIGTGFFTAGLLGNLYDRIFNDGKVRDFLDFYITLNGKQYHWPAFNVADSLLCAAVGLLIISSMFLHKPKNA